MIKSKLLIVLSLFSLTMVSSGCVPFFVGSAVGALGGYAISRNTIQGETDKDYDALWEAAVNVAKIRGSITNKDKAQGYLQLEVNSSRATIRIFRLTESSNRLKVSARTKLGLPNINLAQDIFVKIYQQIE